MLDTFNIFLKSCNEHILSILRVFLVIVSAQLVLLVVSYFTTIVLTAVNGAFLRRREERWNILISDIIAGKTTADNLRLSTFERRFFRKMLLDANVHRKPPESVRLQAAYNALGFLADDIRRLGAWAWWRRIDVLRRLENMAMADAEPYVLPLLHQHNPQVRYAAVSMLATIDSPHIGERLEEILLDNSRWSYRYLTNLLYRVHIPTSRIVPLARSADRDISKVGIMLLGKKGRYDAVPALRQACRDNEKDVRVEAIRALGRVGGHEAARVIETAAKDHFPEVRIEVARALGLICDPDSMPILESLMTDPDFDVRYETFFVLRRCGNTGFEIINHVTHGDRAVLCGYYCEV